jgi:threonyl-tRNA synthetase
MESHQEIGTRLDLFFIDETSPGSIFWKPRGTILFNNLIKIIRDLYDLHDYTEVVTPNIFEKKLWETSGHWEKFRENMFIIADTSALTNNSNPTGSDDNIDKINIESVQKSTQVLSIKPMNCPSHCLVFKHMRPFSKDLPIRMAEFGVLHRNEASGSLHGLTRVRRFQQDDAHIFCRFDQIHQEVLNTLKMIKTIYGLFDLKFNIKLSTRPDNFIGTIEIWDKAEMILEAVIKEFTQENTVVKNIGDGAFYGPKIDITIFDKYNRAVQCGTVQLDFNLPSEERFNLTYVNEKDQSKEHPVIVHRAILGSVERFIGIILEHTQGRLPIQVSPYPIIITTVHKEFNHVAHAIHNMMINWLRDKNVKLKIDIDDSTDDIKTKIKSAERKGYCYIVTIGKNEMDRYEKETHDIINSTNVVVAVRKNKKVNNMTIYNLLRELEVGTRLTS